MSRVGSSTDWLSRVRRFGRHRLALRAARAVAPACEPVGEHEHVGPAELLVDGQVVHDAVGDVVRGQRVGDRFAHRPRADLAQERLLPADAPEVGDEVGGLPLLRARVEELEMAGAHERQRRRAVEIRATGPGDREVRERVARRCGEVDRDGAERVDDLAERVEVDLDVVVDGNVEVVRQRVDHALWSVVEGGVDLRLAPTRDVDPEVAGERHEEGATGIGIRVEHHDGVGALAPRVGRVAERLLVARVLDEVAGVGPDDEVVRAASTGWVGERQVDALGRRELVFDEQVHEDQAADDQRHHEDEREDESARERLKGIRGHPSKVRAVLVDWVSALASLRRIHSSRRWNVQPQHVRFIAPTCRGRGGRS